MSMAFGSEQLTLIAFFVLWSSFYHFFTNSINTRGILDRYNLERMCNNFEIFSRFTFIQVYQIKISIIALI